MHSSVYSVPSPAAYGWLISSLYKLGGYGFPSCWEFVMEKINLQIDSIDIREPSLIGSSLNVALIRIAITEGNWFFAISNSSAEKVSAAELISKETSSWDTSDWDTSDWEWLPAGIQPVRLNVNITPVITIVNTFPNVFIINILLSSNDNPL